MLLNPFRRKAAPAESAETLAPVESAPRGGATMTTATVRDLLIVTYAVPAERLTGMIPTGLTLDRLPDNEGNLLAFVQVVCGLYQGARWSPLPEFAGDAFYQVLYRVLVRRTIPAANGGKPEKRPGTWVLRTLANTTERHISRRLVDREVDFARISLFVDGDPARNAYQMYRIRAEADCGPTHLTAQFAETPPLPPPFRDEADLTSFLTQRSEQFFRLSVPGTAVGLFPSRYQNLTPVRGTLSAARLTPLVDSGILVTDEALKPLVVQLQPSLTIHTFPPRPIKLPVTLG